MFPTPIGKLRASKEVFEDIKYFKNDFLGFFLSEIEIGPIFDPLLLKECRGGVKVEQNLHFLHKIGIDIVNPRIEQTLEKR